VSFAAITLYVVYFIIDSVRKRLDIPSYYASIVVLLRRLCSFVYILTGFIVCISFIFIAEVRIDSGETEVGIYIRNIPVTNRKELSPSVNICVQ